MNVTIEDLLLIIGDKEVTLATLRKQIADLQREVARLAKDAAPEGEPSSKRS